MSSLRIFALGLFLVLAACGPQASQWPQVSSYSPYTLDSGDVVRINVFGQAELTGNYTLDEQGNITLPLIGVIHARGKSAPQLGNAVATGLRDSYIRDPDVVADVRRRRPFYIQGAVANAGAFPYQVGLTARQAVILAGGHAQGANRKTITIYRNVNGEVQKRDVLLDFLIRPGDIIVVKGAL